VLEFPGVLLSGVPGSIISSVFLSGVAEISSVRCMWFVIASVQQRELVNRFFGEFLLVGEIIAKRKEKEKSRNEKSALVFFAWGRFLRDLKISFPCGFWEAVEGRRVAEVDLVCCHTGFAGIFQCD